MQVGEADVRIGKLAVTGDDFLQQGDGFLDLLALGEGLDLVVLHLKIIGLDGQGALEGLGGIVELLGLEQQLSQEQVDPDILGVLSQECPAVLDGAGHVAAEQADSGESLRDGAEIEQMLKTE